ncbi:MAG: hypothetical protein LBC88_07740 [Spirochaetaceae bacterium]|jgi:hypothetical protein|nr:hypothetical protein [Spirochaetaceae bacterium]
MGFFVLLLVLFPRAELSAALQDFLDHVEAVEEHKKETPSGEHTRQDASGSGKNGRGFGEFLATVLWWAWYYNNTQLYYGAHPYDGTGYIRRPWDEVSGGGTAAHMRGKKFWWLVISQSALYLEGLGGGAWTSLNLQAYKFFGPALDAFFVTDGSDLLGGTRVGFQYSLIQSNLFNWNFFLQWQYWFGLLERHGGVAGSEMRVYPLRPLTLRAVFAVQFFEQFSLGEIRLEGGVMLRAWEVYGGWRWWTSGGAPAVPAAEWHGPLFGLRRWF